MIEHGPREHMERRVEEREQAEHAPDADQFVPAADAPQRRNRERDEQKSQAGRARLVSDRLDGIRAERIGEQTDNEGRGGNQTGHDDQDLEQSDWFARNGCGEDQRGLRASRVGLRA